MPISERTYHALALEDPEGQWELHCGRPREKPAMSFEHNHIAWNLAFDLQTQLGRDAYEVRYNAARLRISPEHTYMPDVCVFPLELLRPNRGSYQLEVYQAPLPLVVEVWSPSTGSYDVEVKLREYQRRGDLEIWRIHPHERTVTIWRLQPDGAYAESLHQGGSVQPIALPGVSVDLDALFD
jgi:Uma2 family endonuclease